MNVLQFLVFGDGSITLSDKTGEVASEIVTATGELAAQATEAASNAAQSQTGNPMLDMVVSLGLPLLMLAAVWFFMMRPQRKREKAMVEMQETLKVGENVVTSAGFFGKIASVGHDSFIVEFGADTGGRSIRVPVKKGDVVGIQSPVMTPPPVKTADDKK